MSGNKKEIAGRAKSQTGAAKKNLREKVLKVEGKYGCDILRTGLDDFSLGGVVVTSAKAVQLLVLLERIQIQDGEINKL